MEGKTREKTEENLRQWLLAIHEIVRAWPPQDASDAAFAFESLHGFLRNSLAAAMPRGELLPLLRRFTLAIELLEDGKGLPTYGRDYLLELSHELMDAYWADIATDAGRGTRRFLRLLGL
ncbi:MAG: hypothetical protein R3270_02810 [Gammaproteobacteria bacterium]|nr:hypothetical protein [Gammaproteobacteria bacterium]